MITQGSPLNRTRGLMTRRLCVTCVLFGSLVIDTPSAFSQGVRVTRTSHSRERTREYIDDYSNSLGSDDDFTRPRQPENRLPAGQGQVDVAALRPLIRSFADSSTQLTYALNDQAGQVSGLRQVYTEALRLSGAAVGIQKRAEKYGFDGTMLNDLQQLDADWRELAYRMENLRGLSGDSRNLLGDINDVDQRIRQLINIQPQFDRRQLNLKSAGLAADLENLQEDIASELGNSPDSQFYRRSISRARQVVLNLIMIIRDERTESAVIVDEYKQFETLWAPLVAKLRMEDDRYIDRGLRRVSASAGDIHQLLLLPRKMDQSQFVYLAKALKKDIDEFFERTPLILVMHLPNSKQALPAADHFYSVCAHFVEAANRGADQGEILDSFHKIEQAERAFNAVYRDVDSDRAMAVLNRITQTVASLRSSLQIQSDDFDIHAADGLAASIQNFTDQLELTVKHWLDQDRQQYISDCLQDVEELRGRAAQLHDSIEKGKPQAELKAEMTDTYETWRRVYASLVKCQSDDRPALGRIASSLTPALVDLRTIISQ